MLTFTIQQNTNNFFNNCDTTGVDENATIAAIQSAVEKRVLNVYPDAEVVFESGDRTRIFFDEDGNETSFDGEDWVRTVLAEEFANPANWIE